MEQKFGIDANNDNGFTILFKKEANIALASISDENERYYKFELYNDVLPTIKALGAIDFGGDEYIEEAMSIINKLWKTGLLSPLTLDDDEFHLASDEHNRYLNKRYYHIYKKDNSIYNDNAFNISVRKVYFHNKLKQVHSSIYNVLTNQKLYISKGGVVTGEYIYDTIIPQHIVDKHCFTIQSIINIPTSAICIDNRNNVYVVDHREPKLKALREFYNVPTQFDEEVAKLKLNIRKYKKL